MAITFTAAQRLAITRRQVKIALENSALNGTVSAFNDRAAQLLQVDNSNATFYNYYNNICTAYENEARAMSGIIPDTYTAADLDSAAQNPSTPPFFPISPLPAYTLNIPLIAHGSFTNNKVKGFFHPTGTDAEYEQNLIDDTVNTYQGLKQIIDLFRNGFTGTGSGVTSAAIPGGPLTSHVVNLSSGTFSGLPKQAVISGGSGSGIYLITAFTPTPLPAKITINSIIPSSLGIPSSANVSCSFPGFSNTERQNLSPSGYAEIFNNLVNMIQATINNWDAKLTQIIAALSSNDDDRSPHQSNNANALSQANAMKSLIATWLALPNTGPGSKYSNAGLDPLYLAIPGRSSFITSRISQITAALGGSSSAALTQSGDTYSTSSPNNPYFNRYKWLNFRINRLTGSLRRYYTSMQSKGAVQSILSDNNAISAEYDSYFLTKAISFNDGSDIVHLKDVLGLSVGDTVTIVSETKPEITRTIVAIMGTTQVKLNAPIPINYTVSDLARLFKTL